MKAVLCLAALCALAAVSYGKYCGGVMMDDPTACTHTCPMGEMKTCEHGGICTCAVGCMLKEDCKNVTCNSQPHYAGGHMIHEEVHCYDGACTCMPAMIQGGMQHGGQHGGMQPGGTHHGVMSGGQLSGMSGMHYQQPMRGATDTK